MTTKKTRREFTDEFKREAVVLLRDSGRPLTQVASELGLEPSVLRRWRSLANGAGQAASAVRPGGAAVPERWSPFFGQVVKLGSPDEKDGPDDGQAEAVWG